MAWMMDLPARMSAATTVTLLTAPLMVTLGLKEGNRRKESVQQNGMQDYSMAEVIGETGWNSSSHVVQKRVWHELQRYATH